MLTPDDGSTDGLKLSYLSAPERWRSHDSELFTSLKALRDAQVERRVSSIEDSGLLANALFYRQLVPEDRLLRRRWFDGLIDKASGSDLIFLDPDNGLEVPSTPIGRKGSAKYVYWTEVAALFHSGFSLLVYQHFPRKKRSVYIPERASQLAERTGAATVAALATSHVLFLLAAQTRHSVAVESAIGTIARRWRGQIVPWGFGSPACSPR